MILGSPTAVALASGNGKISAGDTATVTFNTALQPSSICANWNGTGSKSLNNAVITFTNNGTNDSFSATSTTCGGGGSFFGTVFTGASYVTGTVTFSNSTIAWNSSTDTLTFTMGSNIGNPGNLSSGVTAGFPGYAADPNMTDTTGNSISTTTFTSGSKTGF